jgi:hypothetical protein
MVDRGSSAAWAFTFSCAVHIAAVAAIAASLLADPGVPFILNPPCDPVAATHPTLTWTFVAQSPPRTDQLQASVFDTPADAAFDVEVGQDAEQIVVSESVPGIQAGIKGGMCRG